MAFGFDINVDFKKNQILNALAQLLSSNPGSPTEGQFFYDTTDKVWKYRSDTAWISLGRLDQISAPTADVVLNSQKITGLGTPSASGDASTKGYVDGQTLNGIATRTAATADITASGFKIVSLADGTAATDAVTKQQLDAAIAGLKWKAGVRAATTAAGTLATSFENGDVIDGVTLATGDRILIKNQAAGEENGIYVVAASGAPTRSTDCDSAAEILNAAVYISEGTAQGDSAWANTTNAPITLGTTATVWAQFSGGSAPVAGAGLTLTGSTIDAIAGSAKGSGGPGGGLVVAADSIAVDFDVVVGKFAQDIGDGSTTSIVVTHGLGTRDVIVQVYDKTTPWSEVHPEVQRTSTTTVTLIFSVAPTTNQFRVKIAA